MNGDVSSVTLFELDNVGIIVNGKSEGDGVLCLKSDVVSWESKDHSYSIKENYSSILLHAMSTDDPTHIYTQIKMAGDTQDDENFEEILFCIPRDKLQAAYETFCRATLLNPDHVPSEEEDDTDFGDF